MYLILLNFGWEKSDFLKIGFLDAVKKVKKLLPTYLNNYRINLCLLDL